MKHFSQSARATLGFLVAPLVAAVACAVASPLSDGPAGIAFGLIPVFYFFAVMASGFLGFPAFLVLRRLGLVRWWSASLTGAVVGAVAAAALASPGSPRAESLLFLVTVGIGSALSFWAIWWSGQPRPNPSFSRTPDGAA